MQIRGRSYEPPSSEASRRALVVIVTARVCLLLVIGVVAGCGSIHLYDPARAAAAKTAVEQKNNANLNSVSEESAESLDALLANEIAVSDSAHEFLFQNDLFRMAASGGGDETLLHWIIEIDQKLKGLGYRSRKEFVKELKLRRTVEGEQKKLATDLENFELMSPRWAKKLPASSESMSKEWVDVSEVVAKAVAAATELEDSDLRKEIQDFFSENYLDYVTGCAPVIEAQKSLANAIPRTGSIGSARETLRDRQAEVKSRKDAANEAGAAITNLKKQIRDATPSGSKPSEALAEEIDKLQEHINELRTTQTEFDIEVLSEQTIESIEEVLASLAGEADGDKVTQSPQLQAAAQMLTNVASLADSAMALSEKSKQPPVVHLVIELNRQILLQDYAKRMIALEKKGIEYAKELLSAYQIQAGEYRRFVLELCNFGYDDSPDKCDQLKVDVDAEGRPAGCTLPGVAGSCPLATTWAEVIKSTGREKRHMLATVVALAESHRAAKRASELEYRINDITYRRALLSSESAIAQWKNLIDVPVEQVAAFYEAGVKPEELGDFLFKALMVTGLFAIAVSN